MATSDIDVPALVKQLRSRVRDVRDDAATRALYATDASNYRVVPDAVVVPRDTDELVAAAMTIAEAGSAVVMRGSGTSMAGNAIGGVVLDVSKHLNRVLDIDPDGLEAVVEPGVVLQDLNKAAGEHGLMFGVDPSSASRATLGGMIGNNACGAHSVAFGTTADNVLGLDVALADGTRFTAHGAQTDAGRAALRERPGREGELHRALQDLAERNQILIRRRFSAMRRRISGYALDRLLPESGYDVARFLCGTEGTLAVTTGARLRLVRKPAHRALLVLGFPTAVAGADAVPLILPFEPLTLESINAALVDRLPRQTKAEAIAAGLPDGRLWLLVDLAGESAEEATTRAAALEQVVRGASPQATARVIADPGAQAVLWRCRRDGTGLATRRPDGSEAWAGWEDAAVPPERLGTYLTQLDELMARHRLSGDSYGHFGEGCMHMRLDFDLLSESGVAAYRAFVEEATDLVVSLGGSVSGEHGDGRARSELLSRMYGADTTALFAQVKAIWDPHRCLNPGVISEPDPLDRAMRHVNGLPKRHLPTVYSYEHDDGSFAQAQRRCVGVGKCVQSSGGVMCPSYQVTREEKNSTRGRAHLLWEMLRGEVIKDGWRSREVREALDLCLACKGCLSDCPVNVDMAGYKSEFFHQHYRRRLRPLSHYSMGWLPLWAWLAGFAPRIVNTVTASRLAPLLRRLGGIAPERQIPRFAAQSFTRWFHKHHQRSAQTGSAGEVVLWPDTFNNRMTPEVARDAVLVLEDAGFEVIVPAVAVCCGLTWVSTGQLDMARKVLTRTLDKLEPLLGRDLPVVGLEPSCTALFRHEATSLLPDDPRAHTLRESMFTLAEFLTQRAPRWRPPPQTGRAMVQRHCHQYAVMGFASDAAVLKDAGLEADILDSGCCGLAGNFGFESGHYEVSQAAGERVLFPAVRGAGADTAVVADGFSCRTQIEQSTPRKAVHLAQVLADRIRAAPAQDA